MSGEGRSNEKEDHTERIFETCLRLFARMSVKE